MSEPDDFDALLKARFEREHQHVPVGPFVAATMRRIRIESRITAGVRTVVQAAVLVALILASPWLIAGAARLNAALGSSLAWVTGLPGAWLLGGLAAAALLALRARSR